MSSSIKKIVIIGPESTGKSTLCKLLAEHYKTLSVPEYAREYLEKFGTKYSFDDLLIIAKKQIDEEEKITSNLKPQTSNIVFIDTDMYVMKVWCEFVFDKCHSWILTAIAERKYDLYLLCDIDMPWVKDALREYPDLGRRKKLYAHYKDCMVNQNVPWISITGDYAKRLLKAIKAVDEILR